MKRTEKTTEPKMSKEAREFWGPELEQDEGWSAPGPGLPPPIPKPNPETDWAYANQPYVEEPQPIPPHPHNRKPKAIRIREKQEETRRAKQLLKRREQDTALRTSQGQGW